MIKFMLDRIMFEKERMKIPRLQELSGVNKNTLYSIYNNASTRVDLSVLDRLCAALDCQPGDLMIHTQDEAEQRQATVDVVTTAHPQPKQLNIIVSDGTQNSPKTGRK
jgi:putative transcriptional regulator